MNTNRRLRDAERRAGMNEDPNAITLIQWIMHDPDGPETVFFQSVGEVERARAARLVEENPEITMWAGVACYPAHAFDVPAIIERAELALDAAQEWHQDRIEVATAD